MFPGRLCCLYGLIFLIMGWCLYLYWLTLVENCYYLYCLCAWIFTSYTFIQMYKFLEKFDWNLPKKYIFHCNFFINIVASYGTVRHMVILYLIMCTYIVTSCFSLVYVNVQPYYHEFLMTPSNDAFGTNENIKSWWIARCIKHDSSFFCIATIIIP